MANAKPTDIHMTGDREVPTAGEAPKPKEVLKLLDVSGKVVKLVGETKLGCGTVRRDYE